MTIDERLEKLTGRHEALTQTVELVSRDIQALLVASRQDGENIRALTRIAEIHERRLSGLEEGQQTVARCGHRPGLGPIRFLSRAA
ncbi:MAG: hypothetical protein ACLPY2_09655 [Bryobacteraceae bacterium]|jgi:archaellum component FlaC